MSSSEAASTSRLARIAAAMLFVLGAWSALSVTASASTAPSSVSAANVGHFLCYSAAPSTGSFLHTPSQAKLIDRWHTAAYVVKVRPSTTLCNPATKYLHALSFTSPNPNAHLVCNAIQPNATSPTRYTAVSNQFGLSIKLQISTPLTLCLPTWKSLTATPQTTQPQPPGLDHYTCYKANYPPAGGPMFHVPSYVAATDEFSPTSRTQLRLGPPSQLCVPTTKILPTVSYKVHSLSDPSLLCFTSGATPTMPKVFAKDQFGTGALLIQATTLFCVPSKVAPDAQAAACKLDAQSVSTAVFSWDAQNAPKMIVAETGITIGTPSTYKSGVQAKRLISGRTIASWPGYSHGYAIALATKANIMAGAHAGDVMIYVPSTSVHAVDWSTQKSATGCNAL